ncbi:M20 family metallo-hydrolase [Flavihumibacter sp. UBA7668]|uniref:M20 family metallo-hydrolase n=1 Tax=Flavihumibacter sp. UBA7668 TaxID=1946542 RepID=UPI0025C2939C|nr:M20 family metallo-hydrolase [Flavihumibacter sp. UBA7668]
MQVEQLYEEALGLLKGLISTPSLSREEQGTAALIRRFLGERGVEVNQQLNNVWAVNKFYSPGKPTVVLNSHHDTVKPNPQYTKNPFEPIIEDGKLYGLGSNDAGGPLVALIACFLHFYKQEKLPINLVLAATAEEEISGVNGVEALLKDPDFLQKTGQLVLTDQTMPTQTTHQALAFDGWSAIVGEPTEMELAVAEKGLLVLDCTVTGKTGHAARQEGINALYKAMDAINWFRNYQFPKISPTLGPVHMNVTVIQTENKAHNVVPGTCQFTVDIRVTDAYTHEEIVDIVKANVDAEIKPRSLRMRATAIGDTHPLVQAGIGLGKQTYGSPTCSDKALLPFPALKCGPGFSGRSHSADEFIYLHEINEGITTYIQLLQQAMALYQSTKSNQA